MQTRQWELNFISAWDMSSIFDSPAQRIYHKGYRSIYYFLLCSRINKVYPIHIVHSTVISVKAIVSGEPRLRTIAPRNAKILRNANYPAMSRIDRGLRFRHIQIEEDMNTIVRISLNSQADLAGCEERQIQVQNVVEHPVISTVPPARLPSISTIDVSGVVTRADQYDPMRPICGGETDCLATTAPNSRNPMLLPLMPRVSPL
jgi:hypothetical protein